MTLLKQKRQTMTMGVPLPKPLTPTPANPTVPLKPMTHEILHIQPLINTRPATVPGLSSHPLAPTEIPLVSPAFGRNPTGVIFQQRAVKETLGAPRLSGLRRLQQIQAHENDPEDVTPASAASIKDPFEAKGPGMGELNVGITPTRQKQ